MEYGPEQDYGSNELEPEEEDSTRGDPIEERADDQVTDAESPQAVEVKPITKKKGTMSVKATNQAADINERLYRMEQELENKKERLYVEYLAEIEQEMKGIQDGTSPEYEERLQELIEEREATVAKASLYQSYQLELSEKIFEEEVAQAEEDYERERQELIDKLLSDVEERKKKLQEERSNCDLVHDVVIETSTRQTSRKLRERQGIKEIEPKLKRPKTTPQGPFVSVKLNEMEIFSDLAEILDEPGNLAKKPSAYKKKS